MSADFGRDLALGQAREREVMEDVARRHGYHFVAADGAAQRRGIDFYATSPETGETRALEIKCDARSGSTGNAFIETVSVDVKGTPGWAHTTQADWLLYVVWEPRTVYWLDPAKLRARLPAWEAAAELGRRRDWRGTGVRRAPPVPNRGRGRPYNTLGLLVPLAEFEALADLVE